MIDFSASFQGVKLMPVPTHTECVKAAWQQIAAIWCTTANASGLVAIDQAGNEYHFEPIRYGDYWVIECDGVVVRRVKIAA